MVAANLAIDILGEIMPRGARRVAGEIKGEMYALGVRDHAMRQAQLYLGIRSVAERHRGVAGVTWWWERP